MLEWMDDKQERRMDNKLVVQEGTLMGLHPVICRIESEAELCASHLFRKTGQGTSRFCVARGPYLDSVPREFLFDHPRHSLANVLVGYRQLRIDQEDPYIGRGTVKIDRHVLSY